MTGSVVVDRPYGLERHAYVRTTTRTIGINEKRGTTGMQHDSKDLEDNLYPPYGEKKLV